MKKLLTLTSVLLSAAVLNAQTFVSTVASNKNVILEEYTGVRCTFCPDGHKIAEQLKTNNPGRFFPINIHTGSYANVQPNYTTSTGDAIAARMMINGYPTGSINRIYYDSTYAISRTAWTAKTNQQKALPAIVNVAARCTMNLDTRELKTHVEAYYVNNGTGSNDKLNVFILQNNIEGPQTGSSMNPAQVLPNGNYIHNHMFRKSLTGNFGENIANTQGSFIDKTYTETVPANYGTVPAVLHNLEVVAFIADSIYKVENATQATITYLTSATHKAQISQIVSNNVFGYCGNEGSAEVKLLNMGNENINSITGYYTVNNGTQIPFTKTFNNAIALMNESTFTLDNIDISGSNNNSVVITITEINSTAITAISKTANIVKAASVSDAANEAIVSIHYDDYAEENTWTFKNLTTNTTLHTQNPNAANSASTITKNFSLVDGNCYELVLEDIYGDGICCGYGNGAISLKIGNQELITNGAASTMGSKFIQRFTYRTLSSIDKANIAENIQLFPNPTTGNLNIAIDMTEAQDLQIEVINTLGQVMQNVITFPVMQGQNTLALQVNNLANGMYFVRLSNAKGQQVLPFVLSK